VVDDSNLTFGLLVDEVTAVMRVEDDRIGPPPQGQAGGTVAGVIHDDGELVLVLDAVALRGTLSG
jgi:chemotaxis signal transduction protein